MLDKGDSVMFYTEEARTETGEYTVSATGTDIKAVTQKVIAVFSGTYAPTGAGFDIKA